MALMLSNFDPDHFLSTCWQKRPAVFRQVLPGFEDPLDEHDLAGLALDPDVDSRIVRHGREGWTVLHGPFDDFQTVCQDQWTLMVQSVDRYLPEASELMDAFSFIPYWRMDDLMVSFAVPNAGVGPHTDQYDVFLIQGKGSRRWRVGSPGDYPVRRPHPDLQQIEDFDAGIDVILQPGDMLYVPPGWPHDGVAQSDCLTYSVGFRAPDQSRLLQYLMDEFISQPGNSQRYQDPGLQASHSPAQVPLSHLQGLTSLLQQALASPQWPSTLLRCLSEQQLQAEAPDQLFTADSLRERLEAGELLERLPGCRPLYTDVSPEGVQPFEFFIDGETFHADTALCPALIPCLCGEPVSAQTLAQTVDKFAFLTILATLTNKGYWVFMDE